ncbi:NADH-quinone oxidoreductase subunit J [Actinomyces bowdenii]|uniref:NADH-quinone oxidoreductase subunit J n=1 Tax=Actinomyces bowdenii TaxID=131109 RepID=UPI00214C3FA2|nr:NADH-quinone oxidoreductase subunit J [Actinomyces bowdenii]MCR2052996.1 NADH-quinone oxidoreductase subunit J [Actinomyces bowdenii]
MTPLAHASAALSQQGAMTTGEAVLFGVVALVTVACGLGVLTAKRAVSAAINMIGIMIGLAVLYIASEAPFLGMTQVVVYTGAVMTLVLFVIMLVGVGGEEPVAGTTSPLQRPLLIVMGMALVAVLVAVVVRTPLPAAAGLDDGRLAVPPTIAEVLFGEHVVTMQLTALLLVIAAVGALALTHRQRIRAKRTQGEVAQDKMRAYAATGAHPGQKPMPGVYASTNSAAAPALDAAGRVVEDSVPRVLRARGQELDLAEASPERAVAPGGQAASPRTERGTGLSGMPAMPGAPAPRVHQPRAARPEPSAEPEQEAAQEAASATSESTSTQEDA